MGLHHSPSITADGLILCLDAGNSRSYGASSGNNWIDLTGNGFSGFLTANTTYSSANLGSIVFDGTTTSRFEVANTNYPTTWTSPITIEIWIRVPSAATWGDVSNRSPIIIRGSYQGCIGISRTTTNNQVSLYVRGQTTVATEVVATIARDSWHQIVGVWNGQKSSIAVNGKIVSSASNSTTLDGVPLNSIWKVAGNDAFANTNSIVGFGGSVSSVKIYRRSLSENEIQQNFNALRSRYGV